LNWKRNIGRSSEKPLTKLECLPNKKMRTSGREKRQAGRKGPAKSFAKKRREKGSNLKIVPCVFFCTTKENEIYKRCILQW